MPTEPLRLIGPGEWAGAFATSHKVFRQTYRGMRYEQRIQMAVRAVTGYGTIETQIETKIEQKNVGGERWRQLSTSVHITPIERVKLAAAICPEFVDIVKRLALIADEGDDQVKGSVYVDKIGVVRAKGSMLQLIQQARDVAAVAGEAA